MNRFKIDEAEAFHLDRVLDRAEALGLIGEDGRHSAEMDLTAVNANDCPLDFKEFAEGSDFDFLHDFIGIAQHIDRNTGKLTGHFLPHCARPEE